MTTTDDLVIVVLRESDLHRLHVLLACYESPYVLPCEEDQRREDERAHRELCHAIGRLLGAPFAEDGKL